MSKRKATWTAWALCSAIGILASLYCGRLAIVWAESWDAWKISETLDVRADQSAIFCAICAGLGLPLLAILVWKLNRVEGLMRKDKKQ